MARVDTLRIVGVPGSNKILEAELIRLGRRGLREWRAPKAEKVGPGAITVPFDPALAALVANYQRTASRALWDLYASAAPRLEPLYEELRADVARDDRAWARSGATFSIRERNLGGFAAGPRQVVGAVKNALIDGARARGLRLSVDAERPDLLIALRRHDDLLTVSVDLVGRSMHERGYRREGGDAPLRENLAATLLMLARWQAREEMLVDPMCGSGTIAIEAALMATAAPLWTGRQPPDLHHIPAFRDVDAPSAPLFADTVPKLRASDIDAAQVTRARANAAAARVADLLPVTRADFRRLDPAELLRASARGLILSNPPYGERLHAELDLYAELGDWCRRLPGWRAAFLCAHPEFGAAFGDRPRVRKPLRNGSLPAYFYLYEL